MGMCVCACARACVHVCVCLCASRELLQRFWALSFAGGCFCGPRPTLRLPLNAHPAPNRPPAAPSSHWTPTNTPDAPPPTHLFSPGVQGQQRHPQHAAHNPQRAPVRQRQRAAQGLGFGGLRFGVFDRGVAEVMCSAASGSWGPPLLSAALLARRGGRGSPLIGPCALSTPSLPLCHPLCRPGAPGDAGGGLQRAAGERGAGCPVRPLPVPQAGRAGVRVRCAARVRGGGWG